MHDHMHSESVVSFRSKGSIRAFEGDALICCRLACLCVLRARVFHRAAFSLVVPILVVLAALGREPVIEHTIGHVVVEVPDVVQPGKLGSCLAQLHLGLAVLQAVVKHLGKREAPQVPQLRQRRAHSVFNPLDTPSQMLEIRQARADRFNASQIRQLQKTKLSSVGRDCPVESFTLDLENSTSTKASYRLRRRKEAHNAEDVFGIEFLERGVRCQHLSDCLMIPEAISDQSDSEQACQDCLPDPGRSNSIQLIILHRSRRTTSL